MIHQRLNGKADLNRRELCLQPVWKRAGKMLLSYVPFWCLSSFFSAETSVNMNMDPSISLV